MDYTVRLDQFEGPLDLLLFLVKKNEINIWDVELSSITEQYLSYLEIMKELNFEKIGDYLLLAATLMYVKSQSLLPQDPETQLEIEVTKEELLQKLIEYDKYKQVAKELDRLPRVDRDFYLREDQSLKHLVLEADPMFFDPSSQPLSEINVFDLALFLREVLIRNRVPTHEVVQDPFPIRYAMQIIARELNQSTQSETEFSTLLPVNFSKKEIVTIFMAILELTKLGFITFFQNELFTSIHLTKRIQQIDLTEVI